MAQRIQAITAANAVYELNAGTPFRVVNMRGLGMPPISRLSERSPAQQGSTDLGFRVGERGLFITMQAVAGTPQDLETLRDLLWQIFTPWIAQNHVKIRVTRDDGKMRQIDCYYNGLADLEFVPELRPGNMHRVVVPLTAPVPVWYDPAQKSKTFTSVTGGSFGFQIPMEIPWVQAQGTVLDASEPVTYTGTWPEYPTITVTGPATDLVITNLSTGKKLDFTGSSIGSADVYTIRTAFGQKDVLNSAGSSVYSELTTDSDLDDWPLYPASRVPSGVNTISVQATSVSAETNVRIEYYDRHIGV